MPVATGQHGSTKTKLKTGANCLQRTDMMGLLGEVRVMPRQYVVRLFGSDSHSCTTYV